MSQRPAKSYRKDAKRIAQLDDIQLDVTQACGTEPPFRNLFWNDERERIYVDIVSGEPFFASFDKFDPAPARRASRARSKNNDIVEKMDALHGMIRIEVRSKHADSHFGHVFADGPGPRGLRYCINPAALRFIPKKKLAGEGYGEYEKLWPIKTKS